MDPELPLLDTEVDTFYRVTVEGLISSQQTINKFWFGIEGATLNSYADTLLVAESLTQAWDVQWQTATSIAWSWMRTEVQSLAELTQLPGRYQLPSPAQGTRAGDCMGPISAWTLNRQTATRGRHGRGSVRVAGVAEADNDDGKMDVASSIPADLTALGNLLFGVNTVTFPGAVGLKTLIPYLIHESDSVVLHRGAPVVRWTYHRDVSTQRSRKYGRGS